MESMIDCGGSFKEDAYFILFVLFIQAMDSDTDWGRNFFTSVDMVKETYHSYFQDVYREAHLNGPAPDVQVISAR